MSSYRDVLEAVAEFKTVAAHITALGKLKLSTVDTQLVRKIDELISQLQILHARAKDQHLMALQIFCSGHFYYY